MNRRARVNVTTRRWTRTDGKSGSKVSSQGHGIALAGASALADLRELSTLILASHACADNDGPV